MTGSLESIWKELASDRTKGSSELARGVLSDLVEYLEGPGESGDEARGEVARGLRETRPEMTLLVNLGHALEDSGEPPTGEDSGDSLLEELRTLRQRLDRTAERIAQSFRESELDLASPVLFSRSGTVIRLLEELAVSGEVTVLESHPGDEGIAVANDLANRHDVHFRHDLEALPRFRESDHLLIGADSYTEVGAVRNKVGTELLARASGELPVVSCFGTLKYEPSRTSDEGPTRESPEGLAAELRGTHPLFEWVSPEAIDYYATDRGVFDSVDALLGDAESLRSAREGNETTP